MICERFRPVVDWFLAIIQDQVTPEETWYPYTPELWTGWNWGWLNAYESHQARPWNGRTSFFFESDEW